MTESATTLRERRRHQTSYRITTEARRLTDARGLDGWTMEDLAEASGVSRRTLFNYFAGKVDAVLGEVPELPADVLETFRAGGPTGDLLEDLGALAGALLSEADLDRAALEQVRRLFRGTPRLLAASHERFESLTGEFTGLILEREGERLGPQRARLLVRLLVALFDIALDVFLAEPDGRSMAERYRETLHAARELLA